MKFCLECGKEIPEGTKDVYCNECKKELHVYRPRKSEKINKKKNKRKEEDKRNGNN